MEWVRYTLAEAIHRTTSNVINNDRLQIGQKAEHLEELLCLMASKLPAEWGSETRAAVKIKECRPDVVLHALDKDLRRMGYQPEQYAVFGALRQLVLAVKDLQDRAASPSEMLRLKRIDPLTPGSRVN